MSEPNTLVYIDLSRLCMTPFTTGIQRVAKEIVLRMLHDPSLEVVLLADLPGHTHWRVLPHAAFTAYYTEHIGSPFGEGLPQTISPDELSANAVFFDIDSAWNLPMKRNWLFPILKQKGVTIVSHLYDIIPVTHPQFFNQNTAEEFLAWIVAVLQSTDALICNADATRVAFDDLCDSLDLPHKPCTVVPLGADFVPAKTADDTVDTELLASLVPYHYLLMVGTIEPRKNHALVLDALEKLSALGVQVVFAGRIGWNMDAFAKRMKQQQRAGSGFFFAEGPTDATIQALYDKALAVAFPTQDEGFGLPVIEAFLHGTPVLASDIPVLREVGGTLADYFDNTSVASLLTAVKELLADEAAYQAKRKAIAAFRPRTWDEATADMAAALRNHCTRQGAVPETVRVRQMLVHAKHSAALLQTLPYWDAFLPFVEEAVVYGSAENCADLQASWKGRIRLRTVTEAQLLADATLPDDPALRDLFLCCKLLQMGTLDATLLMADENERPLLPLTQDVFLAEGRYQAYYCYDLKAWTGTQGAYSDYDERMFRTKTFLLDHHLPTLQYASHQPQIIDRALFAELLETHPEVCGMGLDYLSTYFNYVLATHPNRVLPRAYCTACWPRTPSDWTLWCQPERLCFEWFSAECYAAGQPFAGLSKDYQPETVQAEHMEKCLRWARVLARANEQTLANQMYHTLYQAMYHLPPQLSLTQSPEGPQFHLPALLVLSAGTLTRLPIAVDQPLRRLPDAVLCYAIETVDGTHILPWQTLVLSGIHPDHLPELRLLTPRCAASGLLQLRYAVNANADNASQPLIASIPCILAEASR